MAHDSRLRDADVVAVFDNQLDADEAVLQLRNAGFSDDRIGYFSRHPYRGLTDLINHDYAFPGAVLGGVIGAALGVGAAYLINMWSASSADLRQPFGLAVTCGVVLALFCGVIGWGIGLGMRTRRVAPPAVDPAAGAFIVAVSAGEADEARSRAWAAIRRHGGHELPPGAMMAHPAAV